MATVRAQRLLNSVMSGTTTGAQLQTLLGTASNRSDWQQVLTERGKARLLTNNSIGAQAAFESVLSVGDYLNSPACNAELALSAVGNALFAQYGAPTVASSSTLMDSWFASSAAVDSFRSSRAIGQPIIESSFFPAKVSSVPLVNASTWKMPYSIGQGAGINTWEGDWNGSTVVVINPNSFQSSSSCAVSTNGGANFSGVVINASDANAMRSIAFGAGLFVVVGDAGRIYTSPTGLAGTWTLRTSGTTNALRRIRYANGRFIVAGTSSNHYSTDGITWTQATGSTVSNPAGLVYTTSNAWFVCSQNDSVIARSTDNGATWTTLSSTPFNNHYGMDYGNGFLVVGGGSGQIAYSTNLGTSWTSYQPGGNLSTSWEVYGVAYWNGVWCFGNYASGGNRFAVGDLANGNNYFNMPAAGVNLVPDTTALYAVNGLQVRRGRLFSHKNNSTTVWIAWGN